MLSNVTWGQYIEGMIILFIFYYAYIGLKYRKDIKMYFGMFRNHGANNRAFAFAEQDISNQALEELKAVTEDLGSSVLQRAGRHIDKEELLERLQERLSLYSGLHEPVYRVAINNYVIRNAKEICGVMFSEDELNSAWDALLR